MREWLLTQTDVSRESTKTQLRLPSHNIEPKNCRKMTPTASSFRFNHGSKRYLRAVHGFLWLSHYVKSFTLTHTPHLRTNSRNKHQSTPAVTTTSSLLSMSSSSQNNPKTVAIIGGGIAGLSCASHLSSTKFSPTVFDTGRLRPGGRCSSRFPGDKPKDGGEPRPLFSSSSSVVVDHAAQIITVSDSSTPFAQQMKKWDDDGVVRRLPDGSVVDILPDGTHTTVNPGNRSSTTNHPVIYTGTNGMGQIPLTMAQSSNILIQQDVWISPSNGVKFLGQRNKPQWTLSANGRSLGTFDQIIIAHNGKCADRLMSRTPAKKLHSLLRTNFAPSVSQQGGSRMTLNSVYSLVFSVPKDSALSRETGDKVCFFVRNQERLRFLSCQTRKHGGGEEEVDVWTVLSSPQFGKKFKAPQENLPEGVISEVTELLLRGIEESLDLPADSVINSVIDSQLQLWGAAVPLNTWTGRGRLKNSDGSTFVSSKPPPPGFVYDGDYGIGVCGDWLLDPSVEGAWESGRRLAQWMNEGKRTVGLPPNGSFVRSRAAGDLGIGSLELGEEMVEVN